VNLFPVGPDSILASLVPGTAYVRGEGCRINQVVKLGDQKDKVVPNPADLRLLHAGAPSSVRGGGRKRVGVGQEPLSALRHACWEHLSKAASLPFRSSRSAGSAFSCMLSSWYGSFCRS
jgi:hypothetical protein